ncbi:uncharacterized protein BXZ73DRAFT_43513 [Epithele typhae]|uniref:uncharacterized protein n=1 Tax=Epithele typhae TaxID=378194 RepID=UPI002008B909|nr:uncharacterized protein BXZ73DRAFT_43513 [Epithele typhae]KAH9939797.1 hypothetical protein BXZ73DRAFT_43513 [Epithele typhae]
MKRPPDEWRKDFTLSSMPGGSGLFSLLGSRLSASFAGNGASTSLPAGPTELHRFIQHDPFTPPMHLDLRQPPTAITFRDAPSGPQAHSHAHWLRLPTCTPPRPRVRLFHKRLPWYIDVAGHNGVLVVLAEVFWSLYACLMTQIGDGDFHNILMDDRARTAIAEAWLERSSVSEEERKKGILRLDFLLGEYIMEGVREVDGGLWEICTRKQDEIACSEIPA